MVEFSLQDFLTRLKWRWWAGCMGRIHFQIHSSCWLCSLLLWDWHVLCCCGTDMFISPLVVSQGPLSQVIEAIYILAIWPPPSQGRIFITANPSHISSLWLPHLWPLYPELKDFWRRQWHPTPVPSLGESLGLRSLVGCSPWGHWESETTERLPFHFSLSCIGEGNGNPLQCSCLENPRDRGACRGLPCMGSNRVRHDWSNLAAAAAAAWLGQVHPEKSIIFLSYILNWST